MSVLGRKELPDHIFPDGLDVVRGCRAPLRAGRWLLVATVCFSCFSASSGAPQWNEMKVQNPWAYTYRIDDADDIEFMATTPAGEDASIWLLLVCKGGEQVYLSLMDSEQFPYALSERTHIMLQLDNSESVSVPIAVIEQKQITANPQATLDLMPVLMRSNRLIASITEIGGAVHTYSFSLQPSDLALRDIVVHCVQRVPNNEGQ